MLPFQATCLEAATTGISVAHTFLDSPRLRSLQSHALQLPSILANETLRIFGFGRNFQLFYVHHRA